MIRQERQNDLNTALLLMLSGWQAGMWTALPAIVQSYDPVENTVRVQPTIQGQVRNKNGVLSWVALPELIHCPVVFPSGGGFTLTFPIKQGDEVLIIFASRCIDAWWQLGGIQPQIELRMHDLSDGFAIPGPKSLGRVPGGISTTSTQLRSDDGETIIEVSAGKIRLEADEVNIHGRNKTTFDAGGTGFVYTPSHIDTYTNGVPTTGHPPNPPEVPT